MSRIGPPKPGCRLGIDARRLGVEVRPATDEEQRTALDLALRQRIAAEIAERGDRNHPTISDVGFDSSAAQSETNTVAEAASSGHTHVWARRMGSMYCTRKGCDATRPIRLARPDPIPTVRRLESVEPEDPLPEIGQAIARRFDLARQLARQMGDRSIEVAFSDALRIVEEEFAASGHALPSKSMVAMNLLGVVQRLNEVTSSLVDIVEKTAREALEEETPDDG